MPSETSSVTVLPISVAPGELARDRHDATSLGGHHGQPAQKGGGDPSVGGAAVHEQLDRLTTLGSLQRGELRLNKEGPHRSHPLGQRTAPGWDAARVSVSRRRLRRWTPCPRWGTIRGRRISWLARCSTRCGKLTQSECCLPARPSS